MFVDFNILNQLGSPSINSNTFANRPAAGQTGRLFVSTDTFEIYRDNGTSWDLIGGPGAGTITGTGTATQVAYFTGSQTIGSSANLFWDNTAGALGINTATPGAELDVHGTGIMVQLNSTTATANSLLAFQRSGTGLWRIGDVYNGGTNYFEIFNSVLSTTGLRMDAATNKTEFLAQQNYTTGQAQGNLFTYNLTVPGGTTFTSPNAIHSVNSYLNLSLGGNITTPAGTRQGLEGNSRISFTGAGTLTMTQGSTVRAWSSLSSVYSFNGSAVGTITHLAGLRVCFPDNTGSAVNITNNYGLLINNQTAGTGTVNYTNRWGIYQEGASDINYFNGNLLVKTTTNAGFAADINGTARVQSFTTITAAPSVNGEFGLTVNTTTNNTTGGQMFGINSTATVATNTGNVTGINSIVNNSSTAVQMAGFNSAVNVSANTTTQVRGFSVAGAVTGTGTVTTYVGYDYVDTFKSGSGSVSTQNAIRIASLSAGTNNVGLLFNNVANTAVSGTWDIYAQSGNLSYFAGNVLLNTTTNAGFRLDCNGTARIGSTTNNISFSTSATANFITQSFSASYFVYLFATNNSFSITASRETYVLQSGGSTKGFRFEANTAYATMFINTAGGGSSDQYVNIGGNRNSQNNTSAILELESTVKGFLPPRMTGAQAEAIGTPAAGLMVYANNGNGVTITTTGWWGYDGATWVKLN